MNEKTINSQEINGVKVFRIRALKDFSNVKKGDLGDWMQHSHNLLPSHRKEYIEFAEFLQAKEQRELPKEK